MIDGYLKKGVELPDESIHLLYSANRWEKREEIERHLAQGTNVLCDRYAYSGVAFSMAKGMERSWCQRPDEGLPRPDLLLFLHLSPEAAASRPGFGEERYEVSAFQLQVREAYARLEKEEAHSIPWTFVDAERSIDEVFLDMKRAILSTVESAHGPTKPLWREDQ